MERYGVVSGYQVNSRSVEPGNLFFALQGKKVDGHSFLKEVAQRGGIAAVVSSDYIGEDFGLQLVRVPNVLQALQSYAHAVWQRTQPYVIGVTGSVGKTTVKDFIHTLLSGFFSVEKTSGSSNSQIGLPLNILSMKEKIWVLEMGMSSPGEIDKLVHIAPPDLAVVNPISWAHAAYFPGGIEEIAAAKAEILSHFHTKHAFIHSQAHTFAPISSTGNCKKILFCGGDYTIRKEGNGYIIKEKGLDSPPFFLPFQASHLVDNSLVAAAVARHLGLSWEDICPRMSLLKPSLRRFEQVEVDGVIYLNDAYNANPASMCAALENLPKGRRHIAVLGAMGELGTYAEKCHKEVAMCALNYVDALFCLGIECTPMVDIFASQGRPAFLYEDFSLLNRHVKEAVQSGDVVLVKGSNALGLWRIIEGEGVV